MYQRFISMKHAVLFATDIAARGLDFPSIDPRYAELRAFGLIQSNGDINHDAWASMKNTLLRPHREAVKNQTRSDLRCAERELKKRRLKEARPDGFHIPSSSTSTKKKKHPRKGKSASVSSEGDGNMPVDNLNELTKFVA